MARQRLVKPDIFQHEELHRAEADTGLPLRLAYIGLWTQSDRRGCFFWKPGTLKLNILPFDSCDFTAVLSALETHGFIFRYTVAGKEYGWVPTLPRHQTFNKNEKPNPLIPEPPEHLRKTVLEWCQHGASTTGTGTGSSTGTGTASTVRASAASPPTNGSDPESYRRALVVAANMAITQRFGEQIDPILHSHTSSGELADDLRAAGIPVGFAQASIVRQVEQTAKSVPRHLGYFRRGILADWEAHHARLDVAGSAPVKALGSAPSYLETELARLTGT